LIKFGTLCLVIAEKVLKVIGQKFKVIARSYALFRRRSTFRQSGVDATFRKRSKICILFVLNFNLNLHNLSFYSASALLSMPNAVLARGIMSVCLSVRPSRSGIVSRGMKIRSCGFQHLVGQSL